MDIVLNIDVTWMVSYDVFYYLHNLPILQHITCIQK